MEAEKKSRTPRGRKPQGLLALIKEIDGTAPWAQQEYDMIGTLELVTIDELKDLLKELRYTGKLRKIRKEDLI